MIHSNEKISLRIHKSLKCGREDFWVIDVLYRGYDTQDYVAPDGSETGEYVDYPTRFEAVDAARLSKLSRLLYPDEPETSAGDVGIGHEEDEQIRTFDTGATRDTVKGKLNYVKALSPIVLQRYVQYLDAHRKQPDGSMREFDNWKKGIPEEIYLDGLGRHFMAAWLLAQGFSAEDNHGPVTLEDTLCAIIFGASGWLHERLKGAKPSGKTK